MPEMDGLETLKQISQLHPHVGTFMVSAQTERGASIAIVCLTSGAFDFVSKPSGTGSYEESQKVIREQLLPKVKQCAQKSRKASSKILKPATAPRPVRRIPANHVPIILRREVVAIGVSTGGPTALAQLIPSFPAELRVGVLVVQHMPPTFTAQLANRLDSLSALKVKEAEEGNEIRAGSVLLAPGGKHMVVTNSNGSKRVSLNTGPPEKQLPPGCRYPLPLRSRIVQGEGGGCYVDGNGTRRSGEHQTSKRKRRLRRCPRTRPLASSTGCRNSLWMRACPIWFCRLG